MLNPARRRCASAFFRVGTTPIALVGVEAGKTEGLNSGSEILDLMRHFKKQGISVKSLSVGVFDIRDALRAAMDDKGIGKKRIDKVSELPGGQGKEWMQAIQQAGIEGIPVKAVGRHYSHSFVRTSWAAWDHSNEIKSALYELVTFSGPQKIFTSSGFRFYQQIIPNMAYQIYMEPSKFIVLSSIRDSQKDAVIIAVPIHLMAPCQLFIESIAQRTSPITDEEINTLMAKGYSYWNLIFLTYIAIPLLATGIFTNWLVELVRGSRHQAASTRD